MKLFNQLVAKHLILNLFYLQAQQSFDLASYYAQFYRPDADIDGRTSPFNSTGAATKYNENAAVVSSQISPSPQEVWALSP